MNDLEVYKKLKIRQKKLNDEYGTIRVKKIGSLGFTIAKGDK